MAKKIKINFRNIETREYPENTTVLEISKDFQKYFQYPILIAKVDNDLIELNEELTRSYNIDFYDRSSYVGNNTYDSTLNFMMIVALKRIFDKNVQVVVDFSIDKGFYCKIIGAVIDKKIVKQIEQEMKKIVKEDLIVNKISVSRSDAIKYFEKNKYFDKVKVLKYISNTYVNLYRLDDTYDYFYNKLAYSTSQIDEFKLTYIQDNGFVVSYPTHNIPECTLDYVHHKKLFDKFISYSNWGEMVGIKNASDLNEEVSKGKYYELISLAELYYNKQLLEISDKIKNNKDIKLILIAGASSSGKTTTAKKLTNYLKGNGIKAHRISLDDYFLDREKTPKLENGELDLESIRSVDVTLFNKHLTKLLNGEKVELPDYNFVLGKREYNGNYLKIGENEVVIIEGLHCLNDDLTSSIMNKNKYKIYIGPLTQLNIDSHNRIHTSDTRKLRRIVRDNKFRGVGASETLKQWPLIKEGEEKYVFPYQDDADYILNSALIYEIGVLKTYAEPLLFNVDKSDENYPEVIRLINLLRNFLPIPSEDIPTDSVLREFIGNSCFFK